MLDPAAQIFSTNGGTPWDGGFTWARTNDSKVCFVGRFIFFDLQLATETVFFFFFFGGGGGKGKGFSTLEGCFFSLCRVFFFGTKTKGLLEWFMTSYHP